MQSDVGFSFFRENNTVNAADKISLPLSLTLKVHHHKVAYLTGLALHKAYQISSLDLSLLKPEISALESTNENQYFRLQVIPIVMKICQSIYTLSDSTESRW
jgi:hypothetical protein